MSGQRILVVDDERQILRALSTSLRAAGYAVDTAETAAGALAAAAMRPPDAVILDLVLPDGTGTDVLRELRTWSSAPVIVLSAVGDEHEKIAALDAGADDYVTKPVGIDELLARLRATLRRAGPSLEPVIAIGGLVVDLEKRLVTVEGKEVEPHAAPVRHPARAGARPGQARHTSRPAARGLGSRLRLRVEPAARARLATAPPHRAGSGSSALPHHGAGRGLSPRRSDAAGGRPGARLSTGSARFRRSSGSPAEPSGLVRRTAS